MTRLITDPAKLEADAAQLEREAFTAEEDWKQPLIQMAAKLRRAANRIRRGEIKGVPSR